jgi:uncharacterized protein YdeI (YjbR/CyaY-like superfamily)
MPAVEQPLLIVKDAAAWRAWLDANEDISDGVWLVLARKGTIDPTSLTYDQALDEALCSGWIDGQRQSRDGFTSKQRFTPRRKRSMWSARNVGLVGILQAEGRMRPRGEVEIQAAKTDGRWAAAYASTGRARIPLELAAALTAHAGAEAFFVDAGRHEQYAAIHWVKTATDPGVKLARAERVAAMAAGGQAWLDAQTGHTLF